MSPSACRRVAVRVHQPLLVLHRSHRGVHLDRLVKRRCMRPRQVGQEARRPRPAVAVVLLQIRIHHQRRRSRQGNQQLVLDPAVEVGFVQNPFQPVGLKRDRSAVPAMPAIRAVAPACPPRPGAARQPGPAAESPVSRFRLFRSTPVCGSCFGAVCLPIARSQARDRMSAPSSVTAAPSSAQVVCAQPPAPPRSLSCSRLRSLTQPRSPPPCRYRPSLRRIAAWRILARRALAAVRTFVPRPVCFTGLRKPLLRSRSSRWPLCLSLNVSCEFDFGTWHCWEPPRVPADSFPVSLQQA